MTTLMKEKRLLGKALMNGEEHEDLMDITERITGCDDADEYEAAYFELCEYYERKKNTREYLVEAIRRCTPIK